MSLVAVLFTLSWLTHLRDYYQDIEAVVTAKLSTWKVQHLGLWVDQVCPPATGTLDVPSAADLMLLEDQANAAKFREIRALVAQDIANMCQYNASVEEHNRRLHVVQVMHERGQVEVGKEFLGLF